MARLTSPVYNGGDPQLGDLFPTLVPEPEKLVYEYLHDSTRTRLLFPADPSIALTLPAQFNVPPAVAYDASRQTQWGHERDNGDGTSTFVDDEHPVIPVIRGYPTFPAHVPGIGVFLSPNSEDQARATLGGNFAGDVVAHDDLRFPADGGLTFPRDGGLVFQGDPIAAASYYAYPLHATVVVELIHENRDERDRIHYELWRLLAPLARELPDRDPLYFSATLSEERQELPIDEQPFPLYVGLFTLEVEYEMRQAVDVVGPAGVVQSIGVTVVNDPSTPLIPEE